MRNTRTVVETRKIRSLLDQNLKRSLTFEMKFDACLKTSTRLGLLQSGDDRGGCGQCWRCTETKRHTMIKIHTNNFLIDDDETTTTRLN